MFLFSDYRLRPPCVRRAAWRSSFMGACGPQFIFGIEIILMTEKGRERRLLQFHWGTFWIANTIWTCALAVLWFIPRWLCSGLSWLYGLRSRVWNALPGWMRGVWWFAVTLPAEWLHGVWSSPTWAHVALISCLAFGIWEVVVTSNEGRGLSWEQIWLLSTVRACILTVLYCIVRWPFEKLWRRERAPSLTEASLSGPSLFATTLPRIQQRNLRMKERVGVGQCALVRRATWTRTCLGKPRKIEVAVKMSNRVEDSDFNVLPPQLARDLEVTSDLPHRNILGVHGVCESSSGIWIVYELMNTDLAKLLREAKVGAKRPLLPPHTLLQVLRDISAGLAHLHDNDVLHRDVKPANVLLRDEDEQKRGDFNQVKLCDFGSSKTLEHTMNQMTMAGTLDYMAPEVLNRQPYGKPADVWSFGVLLFECVTGEVSSRSASKSALEGELKRWGCIPPLVQLFTQCHQEPLDRPSMADVNRQLRALVMRDLSDFQKLKEELKRAQAQDRDTYERVWNQDCVNKPCARELLDLVKRLSLQRPPLAVCQRLGKSSLTELDRLANAACDRLHTTLAEIVTACGGTYIRAPRKDPQQSAKKVTREYGGDYTQLLDLERATGLFEEPGNMLRCLRRVRMADNPMFLRCKDRLNNPLDESGYRDILINVCDVKSGFVMELQLNFPKIIQIKNKSHITYELLRVMEGWRTEGKGSGSVVFESEDEKHGENKTRR